jgi:hypothetical protein
MARVARLRLDEFYRYISDARRLVKAVFDEIEEIQYQFNDLHAQELERWKEQIGACIQLVERDTDGLSAELTALVAAKRDEERRKLEDEIDALTKEVNALRQRADATLLQSQREIDALRSTNPELDAKEEKLKAGIAKIVDQLQAVDEQRRSLSLFPIGWLTNMGKRRRLGRRRQELQTRREALVRERDEVREEWVRRKKEAAETQAALQQRWQEASVSASEKQARLDYLSANLEDLGRRRGLEQTLITMVEPPPDGGQLGKALAAMVELNQSKDAYEQGLRTVAEVLGLLKGLHEGSNRFLQSVGKVYEEQRRYNLKQLTIQLPGHVVEFMSAWRPFRELVKDEKYLGRHPLEFSSQVRDFTTQQLSDDKIESAFVAMGEALKQATDAWK